MDREEFKKSLERTITSYKLAIAGMRDANTEFNGMYERRSELQHFADDECLNKLLRDINTLKAEIDELASDF